MKKLAVLSATRAEYGLLSPVIKKLLADQEIDVRVVVTGMHLSPEFGSTWKEIEADGVAIDRKIEMLLSADTAAAISKSMGVALMGFADYFEESKPDALLVLGDRFETLAVCIAAANARVPIIHIHGGEITEGAVDDAFRHCITKLSILHFTATEEYRSRVIQLGEVPQRVFNVGALGVENALHTERMTKDELEQSIDWHLGNRFAVLTFHPVTLEDDSAEYQIMELLMAIEQFPEIRFLATKANADAGGRVINRKLDEYASDHEHLKCYDSLGMKRYLSALSYASFVIGNSSSGLIEAPAFGVPTVNIGDRQKGRTRGKSVIDCGNEKEAIVFSIQEALGKNNRDSLLSGDNPYGDGNTSERIVNILKKQWVGQEINLKKHFFDL